MGYRPKWTLVDITNHVVIVDLVETILEVKYREWTNGEILVKNDLLPELVIVENELFSYFPDGQRFSVGSLKEIENEFMELMYYLDMKSEGLHLLLVYGNTHNLIESYSLNSYRFEGSGEYSIPASIYRQLYYKLSV